MARLLHALAAVLLVRSTLAGYTLVSDYTPRTFFDHFSFFEGDDPTHGTVEYQSRQNASSLNLLSNTDSTVRIGVDSTNKVDLRPAVRITSTEKYNKGLLLVDVKHMPIACGTWPALWMLGDGTWPAQGEIDMLEGANDQANNYMTLHTSDFKGDECSLTDPAETGDDGSGALGYSKKDYTGSVYTDDCAYKPDTNDNSGCQIRAPTGSAPVYAGAGRTANAIVPTFGDSFNSAGGGTLAMEWTSTGIKIWLFGRAQASPADVAAAINLTSTASPVTVAPSTEAWGKPVGHFSGPECDWDLRFRDMRIVVNTDFCGDWGAATWKSESSCPTRTGYDSCEDFVKNNPQAFVDAYWEFGAFRWFEWQEPAPVTTSSTSTSTTPSSTSTSSTSSSVTKTVKVTRTKTASMSTAASTSTAPAAAAPTVIFSAISTPVAETSRPFTYEPESLVPPSSAATADAASSDAATASTTAGNVAAETSVNSSPGSSDESAKGDAQYLVNGKLPLGGAGSVRVPGALVHVCVTAALAFVLGGAAAAF
ncbi:Glycoside hydrolase family 16 [Neofusicoccum parvum]|nr:Glycoside hydrolase family 16 [Neofusicoccum parvum]